MKRQLISIGALLLACFLIMCVSQNKVPDKFLETYSNIQNTQIDILDSYNAYEVQVSKRIDYVNNNKNNPEIDHSYMISLLNSEAIMIDEMMSLNTIYSSEISDFYITTQEIQNKETKSKANELVSILRTSEQYLGRGLRYIRAGTENTGKILSYYAKDANISNPTIKKEIEGLDLDAKTNFDQGVEALRQYYLKTKEANETYIEIKNFK